MRNIKNINKENIMYCINILFYEYSEILTIDYEYINDYNYNKIILIYDKLTELFKILYGFYGNNSINILKKWKKRITKDDYDIIHECIENFIKEIEKKIIINYKKVRLNYLYIFMFFL